MACANDQHRQHTGPVRCFTCRRCRPSQAFAIQRQRCQSAIQIGLHSRLRYLRLLGKTRELSYACGHRNAEIIDFECLTGLFRGFAIDVPDRASQPESDAVSSRPFQFNVQPAPPQMNHDASNDPKRFLHFGRSSLVRSLQHDTLAYSSTNPRLILLHQYSVGWRHRRRRGASVIGHGQWSGFGSRPPPKACLAQSCRPRRQEPRGGAVGCQTGN